MEGTGRSTGRSTGCDRAAPNTWTILELGADFGVAADGADLFSGNAAKSPCSSCSSRAARIDRDEVLGATRSFDMPVDHVARGAAAHPRPQAPSATRSRPWGQISGWRLLLWQLSSVVRRIYDPSAGIKRVRGVPARARLLLRPRAPPVHRPRRGRRTEFRAHKISFSGEASSLSRAAK